MPTDQRLANLRSLNTAYDLPRYGSLDEWLARRTWLREHVLVCLGLWPEVDRGPIRADISGRVEREGYSVEKVFFASREGIYVTGSLYRPIGRAGPLPAVAVAHGHWGEGRLHNDDLGSPQGLCIGLARRGMIAFSYDMMGYNDADQYDHRFQDARLALWGISPMAIQTLNSVRVLDFLASLPDADPSRLAITGESGGGTQTFMLVAADDRPAAAAPVNMVSAHYQGGCVCENPPNLRIETTNPELVSIFAPKPLLLVSCTGDWTANTPSVEGPAVRAVYELFGAGDRASWVQEDAPHNYNRASREHVYGFLCRELLDITEPAAAIEEPFEVEPLENLRVWADREPPADRMGLAELTASLIAEKEDRLARLFPSLPGDRAHFERIYRPALHHAVMPDLDGAEASIANGTGESVVGDMKVSELTLSRPAVGDAVPGLLFEPLSSPVIGSVLLVSDTGKDSFLDLPEAGPGALVTSLVGYGYRVLAIDPFMLGAALPEAGSLDRMAGIEYFTTYNRTVVAERVQDIITAASYLRKRGGGQRASIVGIGDAGLWCLLAQAFLPAGTACAADTAFFDVGDDDEYVRRCPIPLIRQAGDFRTALALAAPARSMLWNTRTELADWAQKAYRAAGAPDALDLRESAPTTAELVAWLVR